MSITFNMSDSAAIRFGEVGKNRIIDHRGAQIRKRRDSDVLPSRIQFVVHPENTLASIRDSFQQGHDVELDINTNGADSFQRNGQTVTAPDGNGPGKPLPFLPVYHDDMLGVPFSPADGTPPGTLMREAPTDSILNANFQREAFIKRVIERRLGSSEAFQPDHPESVVHLDDSPEATRIPTLDEVLALLKKYPGSHLYIELKTLTQGAEEDMKGMEEKTIRMIQAFGVAKQVTVISFNRYALEKVRTLAQQAGLDGLTTAWDVEPASYLNSRGSREEALSWARRNVDAILPAYEDTDQELVEMAHRHGLKIMPWVWNDDRQGELRRLPKLFRMTVDAVITNVPSDAEEVLKASL